ncbi:MULTISPECIES: TOTE conflict system archaeo-eukaryotic primase domain-containing protein [Pseudomonadati]|uniref:Reverse transcriptase domain-containing protein n=1 Tax=Shewanella aestuarii TaxID=1028752 RepID=A0ABT0L1X5_9GAMM|nr:reverse transcriptase domain-containing protein [Shewanella aestuarii]MCL1117726.1 hypothetical protein [Shewanella aestuarii]GGN76662.1 hypothetical protein GCM10009193_18200 [Shewanella aestuarii]
MYSKLAEKICEIFATDQGYFVEQMDDGSYRKKSGLVNSELIETQLKNSASIAIYQRNLNLTIKWICFDFDILKSNLENDLRSKASDELVRAVTAFCNQLDEIELPYLLEFSGNRGYHVWITFNEPTNYRTGYDIQQEILGKTALDYDENLIGIDLFPHTATPSGGVGSGVKMPLSKHKKSGIYSYLISSTAEIKNPVNHKELSIELINDSLKILTRHKPTNKSNIEKILGVFFEDYFIENDNHNRIKNIQVQKSGFSLDELLSHWSESEILSKLSSKIINKTPISHKERMLIVGILCNVYSNNNKELSNILLHEIFKTTENYNKEITTKAINSLRSFNFPSQDLIERILKVKFEKKLSIEDVIKQCIPKYLSYTDARFDFSTQDVEITRIAEVNYLFMNDEVQVKTIIEELDNKNSKELLSYIINFISGSKGYKYYKHIRNENKKTRELISLGSNLRVATSCILKQISYFLDIKINNNSHGYQINKGFSGGYIYKPWLYLWLKFISNINSSLENPLERNYYIVKTDINSFYNNIPHDNLKRLLLGDGNEDISAKYASLEEEAKDSYKKCLDALFFLTEDIVGSKIGLPQGPAYARYLAEIYLNDIDNEFQKKLASGEISLYQRYVDDIFFITKTEESANSLLKELEEKLSLMKLEINIEKTTISSISRFHDDFESYRSQSKYSVDQVSKRFVTSSDKQKEMAVEEFVNLIQSDSCQDDLSFIFSHLSGVKELTLLKNEQVKPAIKSEIGRGSLFKNIFNFILEMNDGWELIFEIDSFTPLQSEVLTSSIISAMEINRSNISSLKVIVERIENKLSTSDIVFEHLAYMKIFFNCKMTTKNIPAKYYISVLESCSNTREAFIDDELLSHLNTSINEIKSLTTFIKVIFTITFNDHVSKKQINDISNLFYAKLSIEKDEGRLDIHKESEIEFIDPSTAYKFYFLICLFTISDKNNSTDLVESMWEFCVNIFNSNSDGNIKAPSINWLNKLNLLNIDNRKANWVISSIVDGNLFRGISDDNGIFEKYHNTLLVYLTLDNPDKDNVDISEKLQELKGRSEFYNWLIDNEKVSIFPHSNKKWFERNIIENDVICLKKENTVLLRKPSNLFIKKSAPPLIIDDYYERLVEHSNENLVSLKNKLSRKMFSEKIRFLLEIIDEHKGVSVYPSIYCAERVFYVDESSVFSIDFCYHSKIIFEDEFNNVTSFENTSDNFIDCYFKHISSYDKNAKLVYEKYLNNLLKIIDKDTFIIKLYSQICDAKFDETEFSYDIALAASLYLCLSNVEPTKRIDIFTEQYAKFNKDFCDKHIFAVNDSIHLSKATPCSLIKTIVESLQLIINESSESLAFFLYKDFVHYQHTLEDILFNSELGNANITLSDFELNEINSSPLSRRVNLKSIYFDFDNTRIINPTSQEITLFELKHINLLRSTDHTYTYIHNKSLYILSVNSSISSIFIDIEKRYEKIINSDGCTSSYPVSLKDESNISSLSNFDLAAEVIQHHRGIEIFEAEKILTDWLIRLPHKFHQPLTTLISAHEVMKSSEISSFIEKIKQMDASGSNLFLIKKIDDFNGTHRILFKDNELGRCVSSFSPLAIDSSKNEATLITDVIISGSQIITALKHYLSGTKPAKNSNYFECSDSDHKALLETFKKIKKLNICTVLYSEQAIDRIKSELVNIVNLEIKLEVIHGRDMSQNAFFGTTRKLSDRDKTLLRTMLKDKISIEALYEHLSYKGKLQSFDDIDLEGMNLITRYCSLPKKTFRFLNCGLKTNKDCKPFNRVLELSDR